MLRLALLLLAAASGCAAVPEPAPPSEPAAPVTAQGTTGAAAQRSLWERVRENLGFGAVAHPEVSAREAELAQDAQHLVTLSERAGPFLHYILEQTDERQLPAEIALIPMLESGFQPDAVSPGRAAGLWQIRPATGRNLGLTIDREYDGRHDVRESTAAALNYLQYLHALFDHDWLLAVAAYNSGEGTVRRAIERNRNAGKATDFWSLPLPPVTREYVPRLLALARILADPGAHGIDLSDTPDRAFLQEVPARPGLNLRQAAAAAGISYDALRFYNPGLRTASVPARPGTRLLLPRPDARAFARVTGAGPPVPAGAGLEAEYQVRPGDTLSAIAGQHRVDLGALARWNGLGVTSRLTPGQTLVLAPGYRSPH